MDKKIEWQNYDDIWKALDELVTFTHNDALNPGSFDRVLMAISIMKKKIDDHTAAAARQAQLDLITRLRGQAKYYLSVLTDEDDINQIEMEAVPMTILDDAVREIEK